MPIRSAMRYRNPLPGFKFSAFVLSFALLAACGGGEDSSAGLPQTQPPPQSGGGRGSGGGSGGSGAPTIDGRPGTSVVVGQTYTFQPKASDPDGDELTFAVANLPQWAEFDPATGRISGTPGPEDVATYRDITISVTDGTA